MPVATQPASVKIDKRTAVKLAEKTDGAAVLLRREHRPQRGLGQVVRRPLSPAATALLAEGLVEPAVAPVREYHVRASDGINTYRVFIGAHTAVCAATGGCREVESK